MNDAMAHHDGINSENRSPFEGGSDRLRREGVVRRRRTVSAEGAGASADRLTTLVHELGNLLDGSLRWAAIAARDFPSLGDDDLGAELERTRKQMETIRLALVQMNNLVRTSASAGLSLGSPVFSGGSRITLGEALDHAVDVVRPRAHSLGIELTLTIDERAGPRAAGACYSVILNALHNAIDSIETRIARERQSKASAGPARGVVNARLGWTERAGISRVIFEVIDDGIGAPEVDDPSAVFEPGYSKRDGGMGIGLALSRQIVLELGGRIELVGRDDGPGAVLRAVFPAPSVVEPV